MPILRIILISLALACLGCGGGGSGGSSGGGGSSSSGGVSGRYFSLSASSASLRVSRYSSFEAPRITLQVLDARVAAVGAAFPAGQVPDWMAVQIEGTAPNFTIVVTPFIVVMPNGTRTATVTIGATDASGNLLQSESIPISVEVFEGMRFQNSSIDMNFISGGVETGSASLPIANGGRPYNLTADVPWVTFPTASQSGSSALVNVDVSALPLGNHTARITARSPTDAADTHMTTIFAHVDFPALSVGPATLYLGGEDGTAPMSANVQVTLTGTGSNAHAWSAQLQNLSVSPEVSLSAAAGTVSETAPVTFTVNGNDLQIAPGSYMGTLRVQVTVRGVTASRNVNLIVNREMQRLFPRHDGVALSSFPGSSMLSRQVLISDSHGRTGVPWTAAVSAPWLQVTPVSGVTGDTVTISAAPGALAADQFHEAFVTLSSSNPRVERNETIRVGLWKGANDPANVRVPWSLTPITRIIRTNPVEPWVYLLDDDGLIHVYHVHTGALVRTITTNASDFPTMTVSGDGRRLYVAGRNAARVLEYDAANGTWLREFLMPPNSGMVSDNRRGVIAVTRLSGHAVLWPPFDGLDVRPIDLETRLPLTSYIYTGQRSESYPLSTYSTGHEPSPDGSYMYMPSNSSIEVRRRKFTMLRGASLEYIPGQYYMRGSSVIDMCVGPDGRVFHLGYLYGSVEVSAPNLAATGSLPLPTSAFGISCGWDGRKYVSLSAGTGTGADLQVIDANDAPVTSIRMSPATALLWSTPMQISGDGRRLVWTSYEASDLEIIFANAP